MKVYYYMVISLGIMLLLGIAGVDGIGNSFLGTIFNDDGTIIQPDSEYNGSVSNSIEDIQDVITGNSTNFWNKFLVAFLAIVAIAVITGISVAGFGVNIDTRTVVVSIIAYSIFGMVVSDMWSLVTLMFSYGVDWISYFMVTLISVYLVGFAISLIEFVGGTD